MTGTFSSPNNSRSQRKPLISLRAYILHATNSTRSDIVDLLSSVALAKKSTDEELIARIRRTGSLSPEETISFLHVYKETINDLVELFSRDPELIRIMGLLDATD